VYLLILEDGGIIVKNCLKSTHMSDVKAEQDNDPTLVELKKAISKNSIEALS